jgi:hypothetical protein
MELPGVKIRDEGGTPVLLVTRDHAIDIADVHPYLTGRGYVLREGPKPPDIEDDELGLCEAFWIRRFDSVRDTGASTK